MQSRKIWRSRNVLPAEAALEKMFIPMPGNFSETDVQYMEPAFTNNINTNFARALRMLQEKRVVVRAGGEFGFCSPNRRHASSECDVLITGPQRTIPLTSYVAVMPIMFRDENTVFFSNGKYPLQTVDQELTENHLREMLEYFMAVDAVLDQITAPTDDTWRHLQVHCNNHFSNNYLICGMMRAAGLSSTKSAPEIYKTVFHIIKRFWFEPFKILTKPPIEFTPARNIIQDLVRNIMLPPRISTTNIDIIKSESESDAEPVVREALGNELKVFNLVENLRKFVLNLYLQRVGFVQRASRPSRYPNVQEVTLCLL